MSISELMSGTASGGKYHRII